MNNRNWSILAAALCATPAFATITVSQGDSQVVYPGKSLNFDEPGSSVGPVGTGDWAVSHGITEMLAGAGNERLQDNSANPGFEWLGDNNVFVGDFGVFMTFDSDLTELSFQGWDNSGPPSPLGGGALIAVYDDGAEVGSLIVNPVFFPGEAGTWFDITTGGGMVFDEVRFLGFGFSPASYVDNLTWNAVPAPGSVALLGLGGAFASRRRR